MSGAKFFAGAEGTMEVAESVLEKALEDPRLSALMEQMIADPQVSRRQLYHTAFAQGVLSSIVAISYGYLVVIKPENS